MAAGHASTRGEYGFDAPYVPILLAAGGAALLALGVLTGGVAPLVAGAFLLASAGWFVCTTRRGQVRPREELLGELRLRGDERVLAAGRSRAIDEAVRGPGWRGWFGGPWMAMKAASARKPARP